MMHTTPPIAVDFGPKPVRPLSVVNSLLPRHNLRALRKYICNRDEVSSASGCQTRNSSKASRCDSAADFQRQLESQSWIDEKPATQRRLLLSSPMMFPINMLHRSFSSTEPSANLIKAYVIVTFSSCISPCYVPPSAASLIPLSTQSS
jgi:hypothetical protein